MWWWDTCWAVDDALWRQHAQADVWRHRRYPRNAHDQQWRRDRETRLVSTSVIGYRLSPSLGFSSLTSKHSAFPRSLRFSRRSWNSSQDAEYQDIQRQLPPGPLPENRGPSWPGTRKSGDQEVQQPRNLVRTRNNEAKAWHSGAGVSSLGFVVQMLIYKRSVRASEDYNSQNAERSHWTSRDLWLQVFCLHIS